MGMDAAFADEGDVGGDLGFELEGVVEAGGEGAEVAVVDADEGCATIEDAREVGGVVEFDEGLHAEGFRDGAEVVELGIAEDFGDEQDAIGTRDAGFEDLVGVDDEILAEERDSDRGADAREVGEVALKVGDVGEDGEAGRAMGLVGTGDCDGVEVGANEACGRAGFFDFGDEADGAGAREHGGEVACWHGFRDLGLELGAGHAVLRGGELLVLCGDDLVEDGHSR